MIYKIRPGSIAAVLYVRDPEGKKHDFILMNDTKIEVGLYNEPVFDSFPLEVRQAAFKHFKAVFSYHIRDRGEYLKTINAEWTSIIVEDETSVNAYANTMIKRDQMRRLSGEDK